MQTRSQTTKIKNNNILESKYIYETNIDFDEASMLWKSNIKSIGNGSYKYICCYKMSSLGPICGKNRIGDNQYCKLHNKKEADISTIRTCSPPFRRVKYKNQPPDISTKTGGGRL